MFDPYASFGIRPDASGSVGSPVLAARSQLVRVAEVQRSLLPTLPADTEGVSFGVGYHPLELAGGDYYSARSIGDDTYRLAIADVAGHDAAAAVITAMLTTLGRSLYGAPRPPTLTEIAMNVNRLLLSELAGAATFVTGALVEFNTRTGVVLSANCGHPPPRVLTRDATVRPLRQTPTVPLGVLPDLVVELRTDRLEIGEALILYTDGVIEATDDHGDQLGIDGLDRLIARGAPNISAANLVAQVELGLAAHERGLRRDDRCLLVARRMR